jgi:hypothetical protein
MSLAAASMFEDAIRWLRDTYDDRPYFVERDIVYTVQVRIWAQIRSGRLDWSVFNDYPMLPGPRKSLSADLAIRSGADDVLLAAEFKFEPDHSRPDLLAHKFPVIGWTDPMKDIARIQEFVSAGKAPVAYAVLIPFRHPWSTTTGVLRMRRITPATTPGTTPGQRYSSLCGTGDV